MSTVRMHLARAREAGSTMRTEAAGLTWSAVDATLALIEAANARHIAVNLGPARAIADVAEFLSESASDIGRRADALELADRELDGGVAELPSRLLQALLDHELAITPARAFQIIEDNWDAIGGRDRLADWSDFQECYETTDDPEFRVALDLWRYLLFDLVEVADDDDGPSVSANGLDGRMDGRIHWDDLAAWREAVPDVDVWWSARKARRDRLLPHTLTGDDAVEIVLGVWPAIGGGDGTADWEDIERFYQQSGDPRVRAAIDLLRGPLFDAIEVANDDDRPEVDARGRDTRLDGRIHLDDFTRFLSGLGPTSVQQYMDLNGIDPPVLKVPDPLNHIDQTSVVGFSGSAEAALKGTAELGYRVHQVADGSFLVERLGGVGVGAEAGVGLKVEIRAGEATYGAAAIAEIGALATVAAEQAWVLPDGHSVQTLLVSHAIDAFPAGAVVSGAVDFTADRVDDITPEFVEDAGGWVVTHIPLIGDDLMNVNNQAQRYLRYDEPTPYRSTITVGGEISGEAALRRDGFGAWLEGDVSGGTSFSQYADGNSSMTYTVSGEAGGGVVLGADSLVPIPVPDPVADLPTIIDEHRAGSVRIAVEDLRGPSAEDRGVVVTITTQVDDQLSVTTISYDPTIAESATAGQRVVDAFSGLAGSHPLGTITSLLEADDAYAAIAHAASIDGATTTTTNWAVHSLNYGFTIEGDALVNVGVDANLEITTLSPVGGDGDPLLPGPGGP